VINPGVSLGDNVGRNEVSHAEDTEKFEIKKKEMLCF
jgi:hypothetical protein